MPPHYGASWGSGSRCIDHRSPVGTQTSLSIGQMVNLCTKRHFLAAVKSERVVMLNPKFSMQKVVDDTEKQTNQDQKKISVRKASHMLAVVQISGC